MQTSIVMSPFIRRAHYPRSIDILTNEFDLTAARI